MLNKTNDNINCKCNCPLNGECLTQCLVYKATSTTSSNSFVYYGTSEGEFKSRYNNHKKSFRHPEYMNETELSKHLWYLNDHGLDNNISWEIHKRPHHTNVVKILQSIFVRKSFHHLCWSRHFTKQKNWTDFQVPSQK